MRLALDLWKCCNTRMQFEEAVVQTGIKCVRLCARAIVTTDRRPQKSLKIAWTGVTCFFASLSVDHTHNYVAATIHVNWHCHAGGISCYHD